MVDREQDNEKPSNNGGRVIAYPQGATWIGLLRRPFEAVGLRIDTAPTVAACRDLLDNLYFEGRQRGLLVLELTADETNSQLRLLADVGERLPGVRIVVVAEGIDADCELLLRELGVSDVIRHLTDFCRLTAIARSHTRKQPEQDTYRETLRAIGMTT